MEPKNKTPIGKPCFPAKKERRTKPVTLKQDKPEKRKQFTKLLLQTKNDPEFEKNRQKPTKRLFTDILNTGLASGFCASKNQLKKHSKEIPNIVNAIDEYLPLFEAELADKFPELDIRSELCVTLMLASMDNSTDRLMNQFQLKEMFRLWIYKNTKLDKAFSDNLNNAIRKEVDDGNYIDQPDCEEYLKTEALHPSIRNITLPCITKEYIDRRIDTKLYPETHAWCKQEESGFFELMEMIPDEKILDIKNKLFKALIATFELTLNEKEYLLANYRPEQTNSLFIGQNSEIEQFCKENYIKNSYIPAGPPTNSDKNCLLLTKYCNCMSYIYNPFSRERNLSEPQQARIRKLIKETDWLDVIAAIVYAKETGDPIFGMTSFIFALASAAVHHLPFPRIIALQTSDDEYVTEVANPEEPDIYKKKFSTAKKGTPLTQYLFLDKEFFPFLSDISQTYIDPELFEKHKAEYSSDSSYNPYKVIESLELTDNEKALLQIIVYITEENSIIEKTNVVTLLNVCENYRDLEEETDSSSDNDLPEDSLPVSDAQSTITDNKEEKLTDIPPSSETPDEKDLKIAKLQEKLQETENQLMELQQVFSKATTIEAEQLAEEFIENYIDQQFTNADNNAEEKEEESSVFPYITDGKILSVGGFDSWASDMREKLPNVIFYNKDTFDEQLMRNVTSLWIQTNKINHSIYYKVKDMAKRNNIPIRHYRYASPRKCAEQIVCDEEKKKENEKC